MTILLLLLLAQDPEALVERLRSGSPAEREEAVGALKALGDKAEPALKKAAGDADVDVAAVATRLLDRLAIERSLTPRLKQAFPGVTERLWGSDVAWGETLVAAAERVGRPGGLKEADLAPLVDRALRVRAEPTLLVDLLRIVQNRGLQEAARALPPLLLHPDSEVLAEAANALDGLEAVESLPVMKAMLARGSAEERRRVLNAIPRIGQPEGEPLLREALRDPEAAVRREALQSLARLHVRGRAAPDVAALLADPDPEVREEAARLLGALGAERERAALRRALGDAVNRVRREAVLSLVQLGAEEYAEDVLEAIRSLPGGDRERPLLGVATRRWRGAEKALIRELAESRDESVRAICASSLWRFEGTGPVLVEIAGTAEGRTRGGALWALRFRQEPPGLPLLLEALASQRPDDVFAAGLALSLWKDEEAPRRVRLLLEAERADVRWAAVTTLAGRGDASVRAAVVEGLRHPEPNRRREAIQVATTLDHPDLDPAIGKLRGDPELKIRNAALAYFEKGNVRCPEPVLLELLKHENDEVRRDALVDLWGARERSSFAPARALLADPSPLVRAVAAGLLGAFGVREAAPAIRPLLRDANDSVAAAAAEALGDLGAREAVDELAGCLRSEHSTVKKAALGALVRLDARDHAGRVRELLDDPDEAVRAAATRAAGDWKLVGLEGVLADLLEDESSDARSGALDGLLSLDARARIPEIAARLEGRSLDVRWHAAVVLGRMRAPGQFGAVVRSFGRYGVSDEGRAARILQELRPTDAGAVLDRMLGSTDRLERTGAILAVGLIGDRERIPALIRASKDPVCGVREAAVESMGWLGGPETRAALVEALADADREVAVAALYDLDAEGVALAAERLRSWGRDPANRGWIVRALCRTRSKGAVEAVRSYLADDDGSGSVLGDAAVALAGVGGPDALRTVREWRIAPPQALIRVRRAEALCRMGDSEGAALVVRRGRVRHVLNAIRSPEAWRRLQELPWTADRTPDGLQAAEAAAKALGWRVEGAPRAATSDPILVRPGARVLEVLEEALPHWVLDDGVLRVQSPGEAEDFWKAWWAERKKQ